MQYRDLLASVDIALHGIRFDAANRYARPAWPAFLPIKDMRARLATIAALARDAKPILAIDRAMIDYLAVVGDLEAWEAMFVAAKPERDFTRSVVFTPEVEAVFERFGAVSLALRTAMPPVTGDGLEATIAMCRAPGDLIARADHREAVAERSTPSVYGSRPTPAAIGALGRSCLAAIATLPELDAVGEKVAAGRRQLFGLPEAILRVRDALAHNYTFAMSGYAQSSTYATSYLETARDGFARASVPLRGSSASTISPTESYRPLTPSEAAAFVATRPPLASPMSLEGRTARYRDLLASVDIELHGIRFDGQHSSHVWPRGLTAAEMRARLTAASVLARDASPATALDTAVIAYEASVGDLRVWERLVATELLHRPGRRPARPMSVRAVSVVSVRTVSGDSLALLPRCQRHELRVRSSERTWSTLYRGTSTLVASLERSSRPSRREAQVRGQSTSHVGRNRVHASISIPSGCDWYSIISRWAVSGHVTNLCAMPPVACSRQARTVRRKNCTGTRVRAGRAENLPRESGIPDNRAA